MRDHQGRGGNIRHHFSVAREKIWSHATCFKFQFCNWKDAAEFNPGIFNVPSKESVPAICRVVSSPVSGCHQVPDR